MKETATIYHLVHISNTIGKYDKALKNITQINKETRDIIFLAIFSQTLILTNSFLDEFDKFFTSKKPDENRKISKVKKVVKPAVSQIRKWTDLKIFRNNVLAHNLRVNKQNNVSVFLDGRIHNYNIPKDISDLQVLVQCLLMTKSVILENYQSEYQSFSNNIKSISPLPIEKSKTNRKELLNKIYNQIKELTEN